MKTAHASRFILECVTVLVGCCSGKVSSMAQMLAGMSQTLGSYGGGGFGGGGFGGGGFGGGACGVCGGSGGGFYQQYPVGQNSQFYQQQYPTYGGYSQFYYPQQYQTGGYGYGSGQFQGGSNGYGSGGYGYWPGSGSSGSYYQFGDSCRGVDCGPGRFCEPLNFGNTGGKNYVCRRYGDSGLDPNFNGPVGKCYDELVQKVPPGSLANNRNRGGLSSMPQCTDRCQSRAQCGPGQICCNNGCGNICYTPETTVLDLVNGGPGGYPYGGGGSGGGVYGPYGPSVPGGGGLGGMSQILMRNARMDSPLAKKKKA